MKIKAIILFLLSLFFILLSGCGPKTYRIDLTYSSLLGNIEGYEDQTYQKGDVILWEAVPYEQAVFTGWYVDGKLFTIEPSLLYTIEQSVHIEAKFEYPEYALTIQSVKFYARYDNPNSDGVFDIKVASVFLSLFEVSDSEIYPEIQFINIEHDENTWIVVKDEEKKLIYTYNPDPSLIYEHFQGVDEISLVFRYAFLIHTQFSTGQHLSSMMVSGIGYTIELPKQETMDTIRIMLIEDSYAAIYMDITYRFYQDIINDL